MVAAVRAGPFGHRADHRPGIERAHYRIFDQTVLEPIQSIACLDGRFPQSSQFHGRNHAGACRWPVRATLTAPAVRPAVSQRMMRSADSASSAGSVTASSRRANSDAVAPPNFSSARRRSVFPMGHQALLDALLNPLLDARLLGLPPLRPQQRVVVRPRAFPGAEHSAHSLQDRYRLRRRHRTIQGRVDFSRRPARKRPALPGNPIGAALQ